MRKDGLLAILLVSGAGLVALGGIAIWALLVTQSFDPLAAAGQTTALNAAAPNAPNAAGWGVGSPAPEVELEDLYGKTVRLSGLRGKPVLVNFWATWCAPCRIEMPLIQAKYIEYKETRGLVVLGVNVQEDAGIDAVRQFVSELNLTFPVLLDGDGRAESAYNVVGLPTTFFVDRRGVIRALRIGAMSEQSMDEQLQKIFAEE